MDATQVALLVSVVCLLVLNVLLALRVARLEEYVRRDIKVSEGFLDYIKSNEQSVSLLREGVVRLLRAAK